MKNYSRTKGKSTKVSYRTPSRFIVKKTYERIKQNARATRSQPKSMGRSVAR